ncbi:nucleotide kinase domain-containing protein [Hymenobacter sp.]|jgi:hypothetical protein|uniref:nucleotide kinase domain-containing protein n=1 Tax=Hymenobacter sp. TaxID=1898978 RepID=UPI002ED99A52
MPTHFTRLSKPKKSVLYPIYWQFAVKRNDIFTRRLNMSQGPWTDDPVLSANRFTNIFRASDRVSQYLINLQYEEDYDARNVFFKTLLFKIFNRIETYKYLEKETGGININSFTIDHYDHLLTTRMAMKYKVYSAAYIMPSAGNVFGYKLKHSNHLALLDRMIKDKLYDSLESCQSLQAVYEMLLSYPSLGPFLAFQYAIDLNYSPLTNFSEMDFVIAGPGAKSGILKCFDTLGDYSFEDAIKMMTDEQGEACNQLHLPLPTLWGRNLQLIDCQNLFCEVDKYLRGTNPDITGKSGRTRIKQKFTASSAPLPLFFPPKWELNNKLPQQCPQEANVAMFS